MVFPRNANRQYLQSSPSLISGVLLRIGKAFLFWICDFLGGRNSCAVTIGVLYRSHFIPLLQERTRRIFCAPWAQKRPTFQRLGSCPSASTIRIILRPGRAYSGRFMGRVREEFAGWHQVLCRVRSMNRRGEGRDFILCRGRAPSPGGEGRGEGGPHSIPSKTKTTGNSFS